MSSELPAHPKIRIGHVHLMVADLDRAVAFYRDVLACVLTALVAIGCENSR